MSDGRSLLGTPCKPDGMPYDRSEAVCAAVDPQYVAGTVDQDVSRQAELRKRSETKIPIEMGISVPDLRPVHILL